MRRRIYYTSWVLDVLDEHDELLTRDKTLEAGVILMSPLDDLGIGSTPLDVLGLWEETLHENLMSANLKDNMACTKLATVAVHSVLLEVVDGVDGSFDGLELNKGIHRLGGDALHDDMDWLLCNEASTATEDGKNVLGRAFEGNLEDTLAWTMSIEGLGNLR